jgi:hypothetical protein
MWRMKKQLNYKPLGITKTWNSESVLYKKEDS